MPTTPDHYRAIIRFFEKEKIQFHTFTLPGDKKLHVVIRGVLETWSVEKITEESAMGFHPEKIIRWTHKDKRPMPIVLCILPKNEKHIYDLNFIDRIKVKVEAQKNKSSNNQCHRCQLFGHAQSRCTATPKCVKCAQSHFTHECPQKDRQTKPRCVNCGLEHPANFTGCAKQQ